VPVLLVGLGVLLDVLQAFVDLGEVGAGGGVGDGHGSS
jgi:hypothetical protein